MGNQETGRSMVEMLGVLAVVGVLSIGGIAGYRLAMDKRAANDIMNDTNMAAVLLSQQITNGQEASLNELGETTFDMDYDYDFESEDSFRVIVYDVPVSVCKQIVRDNWSLPVSVSVNGVDIDDSSISGSPCDAEGGMVEIAFEIFSDLAHGGAERCNPDNCTGSNSCLPLGE